MATAAHAIPSLQNPAPEDMDLHSDSGFDFGDGDIDLDFDSAPANVPHDDDVPINDASSVAGHEVQTVPTDQDDFMVDPEDVIAEDHDYEHDSAAVMTEEPSISLIDTEQEQPQALAPPDEDLLDYSDDEAEPAKANQPLSLDQEPSKAQHTPDETSPDDHDNLQDTTQTAEADESEHYKQEEEHESGHDEVDQSPHIVGDEAEEQRGSDDDHHSPDHSEIYNQTEGEDDKASLQEPEEVADEDENEDSDYSVAPANNKRSEIAADDDDDHQDQQSIDLQPVTVNYAGNELWFFKQHDTEESGDWLLEDISLAASSMSDLFQACRLSLGDDVSNEHEIGLRFDHLHNMELYEDNTACVAVSLQRLVDLYHTLHAQDGNKEPDSFYCSLLFRPRFVTLLSDIAKYAEQESGYSGLDAAINAGETHFSNALSSASTEHEQTDWEEEEHEETGVDTTGSVNYEGQLTGGEVEYEGQDEQNTHAEYADDQDDQADEEQVYTEGAHIEESYLDHDANDADDISQSHQDAATLTSFEKDQAEARQKQAEDDLLDYDDEGVEDAEEPKPADGNAPSVSSSTVQGDDATAVAAEEHAPPADTHNAEGNDDFTFNVDDEHSNQFNDQLLEGIDDNAQSYQNYDQAFDQDNSFQGFDAEGNADQNFGDVDFQGLDQQLQMNFLDGAEFNGDVNTTTNMNDFAGTDDFLDLNNASEWDAGQDGTLNSTEDAAFALNDHAGQDQEDDAANHSAVATSSAADPEIASSVDVQTASPQGIKRSIDEAGHGMDDALDSIGMLGGRLLLKRHLDTDFFPDAKRPRV